MSWDPASEIWVDAFGVVHVDQEFLDDVVVSPSPLWSCDDATIEAFSTHFAIDNASAGELLYELGLRDGDIPEEINGMPLYSYDDAIDAFATLYLDGVTEYELVVTRSATNLEFDYVLE